MESRSTVKQVALDRVELDTSIQCRATIDTAVVNDYAERMAEGDKFPPVTLFGTKDKCWIGDGWHRIMAARQVGAKEIAAELRKGGRADALKHALGANAEHGHRRNRDDVARCIQIAVCEFPKLTQGKLAEMVGCSRSYVCEVVASDNLPRPATVTGSDGKQYPATRERQEPKEAADTTQPAEHPGACGGSAGTEVRAAETSTSDIEEERDSETFVRLRQNWRAARKGERQAFLKWLKRRKEL